VKNTCVPAREQRQSKRDEADTAQRASALHMPV
jgi:hypothetical protein